MPGQMILRVWDVQHGACAMLTHESDNGVQGRLAMIDSGDNGLTGWKPSIYIRNHLQRSVLDSDKSIIHSTQRPHYQYAASDPGVLVSNTNRRRRCLTTRKDGSILFKVRDDGQHTITTEYGG